MSTTDLSILADAVTFAILVAIGGAIAYAIARAAWKRRSMHQTAKVGLSAAALVAVGLAGVAVWPTARDGVSSAADIAGFDVGSIEVPEGTRAFVNPSYVASPPKGRAARVWQAAPGGAIPGGLDIAPPEGTNPTSPPTNETESPTDTDSTGPPTTVPPTGPPTTVPPTTVPPTTDPPTTVPPTTDPPTTDPPTTDPPTTDPPTTDPPTTVPPTGSESPAQTEAPSP